MKKIYALFLLIMIYSSATAQCLSGALSVSNGTSGLGRAPGGNFMSIRTVYLITPTEMAAAGFANGQAFSEIGWTYATAPAAAVTGNLSVYLQNTTDATYLKTTDWAASTASMSQHRNASTTLPAALGQFSVPLTSSFNYTGGGVYVAFEWINCGTPIASFTVNCNTSLAAGLRNITSTTSCVPAATMTSSSAFRPLTAFGSAVPNDAKVTYIYNQGTLLLGKSANLPFSASVTNNSGTAMTNLPVTLQISGANTFTTTTTIANLPACSTQVVAFATTYTPSNEGIDSVSVFLQADANPLNDTVKRQATIGKQKMAYRNVGENSIGGVGVNAGTGTIAIKFNTTTAGFITHADLSFNTVTIPSQYRIAIFPDNLGVPSATAIYTDAANRTNATGNISVKLDNPVSVPAGTFYLALQQMSTDNMALGYSSEAPLRTGTFYFSTNPPLTWTDLGGGVNQFKVISGVRFCLPVTPNAIVGPTSGCEGSAYLFTVDTVGKDGASSFNWILPAGYNGASTTDSITITAGPTSDTIRCVAVFPCGTTDTLKFAFASAALTNQLALSNAGNTVSTTGTESKTSNLADGQFAYYSDNSCNPYGVLSDAVGGNILGNTLFSVTVNPSIQTLNAQPYLRRWFTITPANNGPADVLVFISQADFADYNASAASVGWPQMPTTGSNTDPNIANVRISKVDGALGVGPSSVITPSMNWNASTNYWELTFPVSSFSSFYFHAVNPANQALPVTWQSFTVAKKETASQLNWVTSSEKNNSHFIVQHSTDGQQFNTLSKLDSKAPNGSSDIFLHYDYDHLTPVNGPNYYRIKQVDQDGNESFSTIKNLVWGGNGNSYTVYPQPANNQLQIDAVADKGQLLTIELSDLSGRIISTQSLKVEKGTSNFSLDVEQLTNGFYLIRISENNKISFTQKVSIQH